MKYYKLTHPTEGFSLPWKMQDVYIFETPKGNASQFYYKTVGENMHVLKAYGQFHMALAKGYNLDLNRMTAFYGAFLLKVPQVKCSKLSIELENVILELSYENPDHAINTKLVDQLIKLIEKPVAGVIKVGNQELTVKIKEHQRTLPNDVKQVLEPYILSGFDQLLEEAQKEKPSQSQKFEQLKASLISAEGLLSKYAQNFTQTNQEAVQGIRTAFEELSQCTYLATVGNSIPSGFTNTKLIQWGIMTTTGLLGVVCAKVKGELKDPVDVQGYLSKILTIMKDLLMIIRPLSKLPFEVAFV